MQSVHLLLPLQSINPLINLFFFLQSVIEHKKTN